LAKRSRKILGGFTFGFISVVAIFVIMLFAFGLMNESKHQEIQETFSGIPRPSDRDPQPAPNAAPSNTTIVSGLPETAAQTRQEPTRAERQAAVDDWQRLIELYAVSISELSPEFTEINLTQEERIYFQEQPVPDWAPIVRAEADEFLEYARMLLNELSDLTEMYPPDLSSYGWRNLKGRVRAQVGGAMMKMLDFLYLDAIVQSSIGNTNGAFEAVMTGVRLAKTLPHRDSRHLFHMQDYYRAMSMMADALQEAFPPGRLTDDQSNIWFSETRNAHERELFMITYQRENYHRARGRNNYVKTYLTTQGFKNSLGHRETKEAFKDSMKWFVDSTARRGKVLGELNEQVRWAQTAQTLEPGPYYMIQQQASDPHDALDTGPMTRQAVFEARLDLTAIGLLIEQHHKKNGTYPETLDQLEMPFGRNIPKDVFTGQHYVYQRNESNFELRSAGPEDDHMGIDGYDRERYFDEENPPLVWRRNARLAHSGNEPKP
jgi:hypothetical protein